MKPPCRCTETLFETSGGRTFLEFACAINKKFQRHSRLRTQRDFFVIEIDCMIDWVSFRTESQLDLYKANMCSNWWLFYSLWCTVQDIVKVISLSHRVWNCRIKMAVEFHFHSGMQAFCHLNFVLIVQVIFPDFYVFFIYLPCASFPYLCAVMASFLDDHVFAMHSSHGGASWWCRLFFMPRVHTVL